jgi:predicted AlkP superfamily phosphohydrolase/phosphomutase
MKVFVLGLDGATFNCLNPLMEEGVIPTIKKICSNGAYGPLKTIFPPVTAPAWLAIATGLNPGKTGVFDYINKTKPNDDNMVPISSAYYDKRAIWGYLNDRGNKTGIFNYPTLSPPPEVNGFAVTGIGRYAKENLCFPAYLEDELNKIANGYENQLNLRNPQYKKNINLFFEDIERIITKQAAALKFLVREKEWDFFFGVFSVTDWIQHVLWKYIDKNHPLYDPKTSPSVTKKYKEIWKLIDTIIGELLTMLPDDTVFMIVSDHGAGPIDSVFYPNAWLEKKGWLKKKRLGWKSLIVERVKLFSAGSDNKYSNKLKHFLKNRILNINSSVDLIDIENSLAYSPEHNTMFGCINLTQKGKNHEGFKKQLIQEIKRLKENVNGISNVHVIFPEQIYTGHYVQLSPDIFFVVNDYQSTVEIDFAKEIFVPSPSIEMRTGGHLPEGVFIAKGPIFNNVRLHDISVLDIAPTILALYNIEIPSQIDGKVITDAIKPEVLKSVIINKTKDDSDKQKLVEEKGDLDEMKKMLQSLGYM